MPPTRQAEAEFELRQAGADFTWIGVVEARSGLRCRDAQGSVEEMAARGLGSFRLSLASGAERASGRRSPWRSLPGG